MITDFIKKNDVSEELIKEYEDKLPSEMIAFWKEFGFGTFYKGYLKSINPNEYKNLLEKSYFLGDVSIPILILGFLYKNSFSLSFKRNCLETIPSKICSNHFL